MFVFYLIFKLNWKFYILSGNPTVEIKKTQMRTQIGYLLRACYNKGVRHHDVFGRDSEAGSGVRKFYSDKRKDFRYTLWK